MCLIGLNIRIHTENCQSDYALIYGGVSLIGCMRTARQSFKHNHLKFAEQLTIDLVVAKHLRVLTCRALMSCAFARMRACIQRRARSIRMRKARSTDLDLAPPATGTRYQQSCH